jgi:hypothetical protein
MKSKYRINWAHVMDAFRSGGTLMVMQGVLFGLFVESPQLVAWAKGSVLVGLVFWAGASLAQQQDF